MIIILTGIVGIAVTYLFVSNTASSNLFLQGEQALYLAEGGLEKATRLLLTPTPASRVSCAALSGNVNITNSTLGNGRFTVAPVAGSPLYTNSTLSSNILSTSTSLTLANASTFASSGRVVIDTAGTGTVSVTVGFNGTALIYNGVQRSREREKEIKNSMRTTCPNS